MAARRISLAQQIEEVDTEIGMRKRVYPRLIATRKLGASLAEYQIDRMEAAHRTLRWLRDHEMIIRQRCPELFGGEFFGGEA